MRPFLRRGIVVFLLLIIGVTSSRSRADKPVPSMSIQEFNERESQWSGLIGSRLRIEGRYALIGKNLLRFKNCDLSFRASRDFPKLVRDSRTVEVVGRLTIEDGKLAFAVEDLFELPTDMEVFRKRQARIDTSMPEDWYQLAKWAANRGRFYEDEKLIQAAKSANITGLGLEKNTARDRGPDAIFALADKAAHLQLSKRVQDELNHEGCYRLWEEASRADESVDRSQKVAAIVFEKLPGAKIPLRELQPELRRQYLANPADRYAEAADDVRKTLDRILYSEIILSGILKDAKDDGSDGQEIASRIEKSLPEFVELAETYRERAFSYRLAHVASASLSDMTELASALKARNEPERARSLVKRWLDAREDVLRRDGADGLRQLAVEYETLLSDKKKAAQLLIEAYDASGGAAEVDKELRRLGYIQTEGRWLTREEFDVSPQGEIRQAMREGRVVDGMTAQQVRQTLGVPGFVARMIADGQVAEVWIYGERNATQLAIHFVRPLSRSEFTVQGISQGKVPRD